jgi:hypothetical protein
MRSLLVATLILLTPLAARAGEEDQYLLDDTHLLIAIDVQQVRKSPFYMKAFQQQAEQLLRAGPVSEELKKAGFDPLRDISRLVVIMGFSCHRDDVRTNGGAVFTSAGGFPLVLVQGRFDADKLHAWARGHENDGVVKTHESTAGRYYRIGSGPSQPDFLVGYVAVLDQGLIAIAGYPDQIEDVLAKKAGKKQTTLKDPAMKALLAQRDPRLAVQFFASRELVLGTSVRSISMNGQSVTEVKRRTLADSGFETASGRLTIDKELAGQLQLTAEKPEPAKELAATINESLKMLANRVGGDKELAPLADMLKTVAVSQKDRELGIEAKAGPEAIVALFLAFQK